MIEAPDLSLAALAPLLFLFGAACIGVVIEAFAPRESRHPAQVAVALVGTVGGLVSAVVLAATRDLSGDGAEVTAGGALAVDGAGVFLQATIAGLGALSILLFAERSLDPARSSFVAAAAVRAVAVAVAVTVAVAAVAPCPSPGAIVGSPATWPLRPCPSISPRAGPCMVRWYMSRT